MLAAAAEVVKKGLARVTLLGKPAEVAAAAEMFGVDVSGCAVLDFAVGGCRGDGGCRGRGRQCWVWTGS